MAGPTVTSSNNGATWGSTPANTALTAYAVVDYDGNYAKFRNINWTSGEMPQTLETLLQYTASSGNILTSVMDDSPGGTLLGDCLISSGVNLSGTAGFTLRGASGYKIELVPSTQRIKFYANSVLISSVESLAYLPTGIVIHAIAGMWNGFLYCFVNGVLAASHYDNTITLTGVVGYYGSGTFTNFRVPDLTAMYDYFVLNDSETPQQALDQLVGQPTSRHHPQRVHWFINYQGSFRAISGDNPTIADTYDSSVTGLRITGKKRTRRFSIGQWLPQGNYYATRWFAAILKRVGRRVKHADYATGSSDAQAYEDAVNPMREAEEQAQQFTLEAVANYALEREDVIAVVDVPTGTNGNYLITDLNFRYSGVEKADPMMTLNLRQVVP